MGGVHRSFSDDGICMQLIGAKYLYSGKRGESETFLFISVKTLCKIEKYKIKIRGKEIYEMSRLTLHRHYFRLG